MADNTFTIGAVVDVAQLATGMNEAGQITKAALDDMMASFNEASPAAARAVARIAEDTKIAAVSVDESWQRAAKASLAYSAALKEVSAATYLARKSGEDDAAATNLLAAAKQKAAAASAELAAAEKEVAVQAEVEAVSLGELGASASSAFSMLTGPLMGGALAGGIFMHMATEAADFNLQMSNLQSITGISATTLAGLHDVVKEMHGDFDSVSVGLAKMLKAQQDAVDGSKKQVEGFKMLGISVNELKSLTPEELFFRVADGMDKVGSSSVKNTAAIDIFGRGGRSLIAVFEALGPALRDRVEEEAKASGVTEQSIADAKKYAEVVEELSVVWRSFASSTIPVVMAAFAEIGAALEALGSIGINALNVIGAAVMSLLEGMKGLGLVLKDVVTGNFSAIAGDARTAAKSVGDEWKDVGQNIKNDWKEISQAIAHPLAGLSDTPQIPKMPGGEDLPGPAEGGKDTRLEEWRRELQAKKDAQDGLDDLSKGAEAKFWEDKLATVKAGTKIYAEVLHQMREAERADQKESLKEEDNLVTQRLASTKRGSIEQVAILQEEVNHLQSIHAEKTSEFERRETELNAAIQAYAEQQGKDVVELERRKVDATRKGSEERVAAERAVLAEMVTLHLQETSEYTAQLAKVIEAEKQLADERMKLAELDVEQERIVGVSKVQVARQNVQAEFDLHLINAQQRIAALKQLEDQEYEITKASIEKKLVLMQQDPTMSPVQIKQLQNQIENLTREHNDKIAALNTQSVKDSQQKFDTYFAHINSGFASSLTGMLEGTKTFAKGMQDVWNNVVSGIIGSISGIALKWIEQHLLMRAFNAIFHTQQVTEEVAAAAAQTAARAAANVTQATSDAGLAAAGTFAWYSAVFPPIAPAMAAAAYGEGMGFASLAAFHGGGIAGEEQVAVLKRNEMVLPPALSRGFQNVLGSLSPGAPAPAASPGGGSGGGSGVTFGDVNYSPTFNHPASAAQDPRTITKMVQRSLSKKLGIPV
jgi:hypothetical protein